MDSILNSVKKLIGIDADDTSFDVDVIIHINTAFMTLNQLGVGPAACFSITDATSTWQDFTTSENLEAVKTYVSLKVKLIFDPPSSSAAIESINRLLSEFEWRLNVQAEGEIQNG